MLRGLVALTLYLGVAGFIGGMAQSTGFSAGAPLALHIAELHGDPGRPVSSVWGLYFERVQLSWWRDSKAEVLGSAPGPDLWVLTDLLWLPVGAVPFALCIALALPGVRAKGLVRLGQIAVGLAAGGVALYYIDSERLSTWEYAMSLAEWRQGMPFGVLALVVGGFLVLVALHLARPALRAVVRWVVGDRVRGSTLLLWTADGLPAPGHRTRSHEGDADGQPQAV